MAHLTAKRGYSELAERLNRFPQGAPASETLFKILSILMSEKEGRSHSTAAYQTVHGKAGGRHLENDGDRGQKTTGCPLRQSSANRHNRKRTDNLCIAASDGRLLRIFDDAHKGRHRPEAPRRTVYQYMNVEEDFIKNLFVNGETQLGRTFVNESMLSEDKQPLCVRLRTSNRGIKTASHIGVSMCYCRHKMQHKGMACDAPMDICMTFNNVGSSLIRHGYARQIDISECMDLLDQAYEHNLVQFGENTKSEVSFICNCCGCCCEALIAARKFGIMNPVHTSNFIPEIDLEKCTGCGKCAELCPVESMTMVSANDPHKPKRKIAKLDEQTCLGCAVCLRGCKVDALKLKSREKRIITPESGVHKVVMMAVGKGRTGTSDIRQQSPLLSQSYGGHSGCYTETATREKDDGIRSDEVEISI